MRYLYKAFSSLIIFFCFSFFLEAQENYASNVKTDISTSQKMLITYDLLSPEPGALYNVTFSLTHRGSTVKFNNAFGDFGRLIAGGRGKAIVWYYKDDYQGDISEVKVDIVASIITPPKADFKFEVVGSKLPFQVRFQNQSINCDSFVWNFDDPGSGPSNTSEEKNPEHTYLRARIYTVKMIATSSESGLLDSISLPVRLNIGELPVANFSFRLTSSSAPATAWFKNASEKANEYYWNFDDPDSGSDNFSAKKNPVHIYTSPGNYDVVLTVTNSKSKESHSHTKEVVVSGSK